VQISEFGLQPQYSKKAGGDELQLLWSGCAPAVSEQAKYYRVFLSRRVFLNRIIPYCAANSTFWTKIASITITIKPAMVCHDMYCMRVGNQSKSSALIK